jgi:hypothetical protein
MDHSRGKDNKTRGGVVMKFMLIFSIKPEGAKRDEAIARFQKTDGMPPKGARLLGR